MGKQVLNPRYNVISLRLSDSEKAELVQSAKERRLTVGTMMRIMLFEPATMTDLAIYAERS